MSEKQNGRWIHHGNGVWEWVITPPGGDAVAQATEALAEAQGAPASPLIDLQAEQERADTAQQVEEQQASHAASRRKLDMPTITRRFD